MKPIYYLLRCTVVRQNDWNPLINATLQRAINPRAAGRSPSRKYRTAPHNSNGESHATNEFKRNERSCKELFVAS